MKTNGKKIIRIIFLIICSLLVVAGITACAVFYAPTISFKKPADTTTEEQPFVRNMSGIDVFRIPSLVTMPSGALVASCDARWTLPFDGGGIDTIVSTSQDNGKSWSCTFANFNGDNGKHFDFRSSTFIDPEMICTSDGTLYLATTFYPANVSLNSTPETPLKDKAFDESGKLLICKGNSFEFDYTLGEFDENGYAPIIDKNGNAIEKYRVDRYFNIFKNDKKRGNLFFRNAPFSVVPTTYIYLNISYDGGKTWDNPSLLNVKDNRTEFFGIAPGRGLELDDGTLILSTYSLKNSDGNTQKCSFIYSKDKGKSWSSSPELSYNGGWSGESQLVVLDESNLRCFFRSANSKISYCDFSLSDMKWAQPVITEFDNNSNCMLSAIGYNGKIDGKRAILVSCPTASQARENGKLFVFTLDENNDMSLYKAIDIKEGAFAYSCLTQNADGTVAILYEAENHMIAFKNNIDISTP